MPDIKWIKLATNMHEDEKMKLIDAMPERDTIHYLWIRLLLLAGKNNADGEIFLSGDIPLTAKMLAVLFSRPLSVVNLALKTLSRLGMIEIGTNKIISIVNWDKHQNIEGMERVREQNRKRAESHREKKKQEKKTAESSIEESYENEALEESKTLEEESNRIEINEETSKNYIEDKSNVATDEIGNKIVRTDNVNYGIAKRLSNVTQNESNVTVTVQNKKEIKNKKKSKKEIENSEDNIDEINNKNSGYDKNTNGSSLSGDKNNKSGSTEEDEIDTKVLELMHYHEKRTGVVGGKNYSNLREAVDIHGEKWVKKAMEIALKKNCPDIEYAFGVLKNWRRDGYPKDNMEVKKNGVRSTGKDNEAGKNEFAGFKPKEPRKLTEVERRRAEANLI